jgi:sigma-B regulation protein RsbU (phosphoserine phosphatase)
VVVTEVARSLDTASPTSGPFDFLPCGVLQTTSDGMIRRVNRTFCTWLGYSPDALVGKRRFQDLLTMGGRIFHQTHWAPLLAMQGSVAEVKLDLVTANDAKIPMVVDALRRDEDGTIVHELAAYVARDRDEYERELVRSRKRLEEVVAEATRLQAEAKDRALFAEQMVGIVSHDLRNPLSVVTMGAGLLASEVTSSSQQRAVARIIRASERANRLIADLLDFTQARLGSGLVVAREPIDLHVTIAETLDELTDVYPARSLLHERQGAGECLADPNRVAQLVGNLVSNAVTYGDPQTPVTITSTVGPLEASIAVHNGGVPIPSEVQETMFDAMTRATTEGRSRRSVGLGLFIVREIARAHEGRATVESTASRGTTFRVTIPRPG